MKSISMTAYNRPDYLKNTLLDLSKNNPKDWHFFISIDPSDKTEHIKQVLDDDYGFASKTIIINPQRKDHRRNQHDAIEMAFAAGSTFNLHFDDDLFISPTALELANYYKRTFEKKPLTYGNYGLFNYNSNPNEPNKLLSQNAFTGLGTCYFRENWVNIFHKYWFKDDLAKKHFGQHVYGWDWQISGVYKEFGICEIFPSFSRTNHMGREQGTCCSYEWYDKAFANLIWDNKGLLIEDFIL